MTQKSSIFYEKWIEHYETPSYLFTDKGTHFVSSFFKTILNAFRLKPLTTIAYYHQTNKQAEHVSKTLMSTLVGYVAEHQGGLDILLQSLTYAYNTLVKCPARTTPFRLVLLGHLPGQTTFDRPSAFPTIAKNAPTTLVFRS